MLVLAYYDGVNVKGTLHKSKWLDKSSEEVSEKCITTNNTRNAISRDIVHQ